MPPRPRDAFGDARVMPRPAWIGAFLLAAWILGVAAAPVSARDFAGRIANVSGSSLQVESRMGDSRSFQKGPGTRVTGARKSWGELRPGDSVVVSWSLSDSRPVAHQVRVGATGSR